MKKSDLELCEDRNDFFGYAETSPIKANDELISLGNKIYELKNSFNRISIAEFPDGCTTPVVKDSIQIWERLGIKLHKVYGLCGKVDIHSSNFEDIDANKICLMNPEQIYLHLQLPYYDVLPSAHILFSMLKNNAINEPEKIVLFHYISVLLVNSPVTACYYNHEIAHTQINSVLGSCNSILNNEVIPELISEIFSYHLDTSLITTRRIRDFGVQVVADSINTICNETLDYRSRVKASSYVKSYLESFNMANIYITGNSKIQDEMHQYINSIFNGNRCVEDMLEYYDSQYKDLPKKLELINNRPLR